MNQVLYVGLDVHKESIVAATAPQGDTEAQLYGTIGGTLGVTGRIKLTHLGSNQTDPPLAGFV